MMLKTSSRNLSPFRNMIAFTLRKSIGIIIVLCIAALLYCPGNYIVNFEEMRRANEDIPTTNQLVISFAYFVSVISALIAIMFNFINFSFLYKKNSSDVFHAFPLTRCELLLSRFFAGLIAAFIPVFICYAAFGIMLAFNTWMGSLSVLALYLLYTVTITLVCSSFSLIFIISAGSMFDLGVSLIGSNLALILVGGIFNSILQDTLLGYNKHGASGILYYISPPYFCGQGLADAMHNKNIKFWIMSIVYIIAFTVFAILLYNKRKAEKSEQAYAYKFMYLFCGVLAGICGGYLLGSMFDYDISSPIFFVFMILGAILTSVIYGVVTNRGFKKTSHAIAVGCASALIIVAVTVFGMTGGLGYSKRIPQEQKISEAYINAFSESICFTDNDAVLKLHKKIVETDAAVKAGADCDKTYITFDYALKSGKCVSRTFLVNNSLVSDELLAIYKSDERFNGIKKGIDFDNAAIFSLSFYEDEKYIQVGLTRDEMKEFLDAYWLDVQNCDTEIFESSKDNFYNYYEIGSEDKHKNYLHFQLEANYKTFSNTRRFIEEHNIIERSNYE